MSSPLFAKSMGITFVDPYSYVCYEDVYVDDFSAYTYIDEVPTVSLGGSFLSNTQINSDGTTITGITTSHKPGVVNVVATNTDGQSATLSNAYSYTYPNPSIASISPSSGYATGGDSAIIADTNLSMNDTVTINGA